MRWFLALLMIASSPSWGWQVDSGSSQVSLLELYTSEGCSSCPPADRWLSSLKDHPQLWTGFIPVAFHVDYWDWIGWPDRFASASNSTRQRRYQQEGGLGGVYTPGFIVDGEEWRHWFRNGAGTKAPQPPSDSNNNTGILQLRLEGRNLFASYQPNEDTNLHQSYTLELAITGFDMSNRIDAGENKGKVLTHDFVVLHHQRTEYTTHPEASNQVQWQLELPADIESSGGRRAITAWVSADHQQKPLQAVGGWWSP